jgi:hypothetical protein
MGRKEWRKEAVVIYFDDYWLDDGMIGVRFPAGLVIFLLATASRPVLGPTQPPIQWAPGGVFPWG